MSDLSSRLLATCLILATLGSLHAQGRKLSLPLAETNNVGDILQFRVSPDGEWVVFRGDQTEDEVFELWAAPSDQSTPAVRLHGALPAGGSVAQFPGFEISSLGRVVFVADSLQDGVDELFSVPIDASAPPVRLSLDIPDADVSDFEISPDGLRVVYTTLATPGQGKLYSVPSDGSAPPVQLADGFSGCKGIHISPDNSRVVAWFSSSLVSQAIDGSGSALTLAPLASAIQLPLSFTPNGQRVVYWNGGLRSVPVDASAPAVTLSTTAFEFLILPSGTHVLAGASPRLDLLPITGGPGLTLASFPAGQNVLMIALTPDASTVVFGVGVTSVSVNALYRVPVDGSQPPTEIPGTWNAIQDGFLVTPTTVLVRDESFGDEELLAVSIQGSFAPILLGFSFRKDIQFELLADGITVVWHGNWPSDFNDLAELYRAPIDGSQTPIRLDSATGAGVTALALAEGEQRVVYLDETVPLGGDRITQLHGVPVDGSAPPQLFNGPLPGGAPILGDVHSFRASSAGDLVLYVADVTAYQRTELFAVRPFAELPTLRLNPPLAAGQSVRPEIALSSDGKLAAFRTGSGPGVGQIWCAPTDGSGPARLLASLSLPTSAPLEFTPDGSRLVFPAAFQLASVRTDGSQAAILLGPPTLVVREFELSANGARVLFLGDLGTVDALYSAPVDGSVSAVRIVPPGPSTQDIRDPEIEGGLVYYRSDPTQGLFELFSVALNGSSAPVRLNPPLVVGRDVERFVARPGGLVVYAADLTGNDVFELHRVLAPGSSQTLTPFPATADVGFDFVVSSDGQQVYYRADSRIDNRFELFSVATDGSSAPVYLVGPFFGSGSVLDFQLGPDEDTLAFRSGIAAPSSFGKVATSGGTAGFIASDAVAYGFTPDRRNLVYVQEVSNNPTRIVSKSLRGGPDRILGSTAFSGSETGSIASFLLQKGGRVFYLGEGEILGTNELFLAFCERARSAPGAPRPPGPPRLGF